MASVRIAIGLPLTAAIVAGCATSPGKELPSSQIEIEESIGFTITEEAQVEEAVRLDYQEALLLLEQGRSGEGIALLKTVAQTAPNLSAPQIDLGVAYHRTGDLAAAEEHLLAALDLNPEHPIAHNELGIIYRKTGRFTEARQSYEAALAIYPGYHYARRNLAVLCDIYLGNLDCALQNYEAYMQTVLADEETEMWIADIRNRVEP